ncbi:OmpW/AlkL family protein [Extensimonas vulgaris]|uniref:Outer membrane protein n=1 Tax=Extensimonas vulgaris TaxID=1031594 RepID=A0A369ARA1_9BURK|nr:OmpW family outer membrane protein [Extensimonas vulgaris]RCX11899.1 outer membrane protein [Extensimonas vulgaris]TWI39010.1 outer membrane protein [Extensimonas vulgaris]TXD14899.1 OmpW family protein [Extensimonas vulgaris]
MKPFSKTLLPLACAALLGSAHAQTEPEGTSPWSVAVGPVHLAFSTKADLYAGGPVPGAGVHASSDNVLGVEIGYRLTPNWMARLDLANPVKSDLSGTGNLGPLGRLAGVKVGPAILTMNYTPGMWGPIRPYFGGGISYIKVFSASPGALQNIKVDNNFGGVFLVGADWPLGDGYSIALSVQKLYLKTNATGTVPAMGGAPVTASVRLDPLVTFLGVRKQF